MAVEQKFGKDLYHNYMRDLLTIRQTGDVLENAGRFEQAKHRVLVHNKDMGEVFFVQKFLDGLKYNISNVITLHKPRRLMLRYPWLSGRKKYWRQQARDIHPDQGIKQSFRIEQTRHHLRVLQLVLAY